MTFDINNIPYISNIPSKQENFQRFLASLSLMSKRYTKRDTSDTTT